MPKSRIRYVLMLHKLIKKTGQTDRLIFWRGGPIDALKVWAPFIIYIDAFKR